MALTCLNTPSPLHLLQVLQGVRKEVALTCLNTPSPLHLLQVLQGVREEVALTCLNTSDPEGDAPGHPGSPGLYPLVWVLQGEQCIINFNRCGGAGGGGTSCPRV